MEGFGRYTSVDIVIHGNGHADTVAPASAEAAGQSNFVLEMILGDGLLKQANQRFRALEMTG